jgi:hypothetical protein
MNQRRVLIGLLVLAMVLVDAVILLVAEDRELSAPVEILLQPFPVGQVSLLAVWAGLGSKRSPWRLLAMALGGAAWSWLAASAPESNGWFDFAWVTSVLALMLLLQAVYVFVPLSVGRLAGLRVVCLSQDTAAAESDTGPRRLQFSLGNLLAWTTAVALLLGILPYVLHRDKLAEVWEFGVLLSPLIIGPAAMTLAAVWAVLGTRRALLRAAGLCLAAGTVLALDIVGSIFWGQGSSADAVNRALLFILHLLVVAGSLYVFRVAGYRLRWRRGK